MRSKIFQQSDITILQQQLDDFLEELDEVTGNVTNIEMFKSENDITVLIIYSCWKKLSLKVYHFA